MDEILGALQKMNFRRRNGTQGAARPPAGQTYGARTTQRTTQFNNQQRRCPNCGDRHALSQCPKPMMNKDQRKCWTCGGLGHGARNCPNAPKTNGQAQALKAIEDAFPFLGCLGESHNGFIKPRSTIPMKSVKAEIILGDFIKPGQFAALATVDEPPPPPPAPSSIERRRRLIQQTTRNRFTPPCPCDSPPLRGRSYLLWMSNFPLDFG